MTHNSPKTSQQQKAERLAEALRANLRRRKAPKPDDKPVSNASKDNQDPKD